MRNAILIRRRAQRVLNVRWYAHEAHLHHALLSPSFPPEPTAVESIRSNTDLALRDLMHQVS